MSTTVGGPGGLSAARTILALLALALGGFGIGATEFAAMGMLPDFARELLPRLWAESPELANAQAGWLISAYALGVVVGAPTIGAIAARFPRRMLLLWLVIGFVLGSLLTAALPSFELVLTARVLAGLGHGAYFGIAAIVAAELMGPGRRAFGVAVVISGLTVANMIGVPLITWLAQLAGFRVAFLSIAAIFALTFLAIVTVVPWQPGDIDSTVRRELRAFRRPQVWYALALGSIGFGGLFAVYSYITPLITEVAGQPASAVPWVLVLFGFGMTVGNLLGGWLADRGIKRALVTTFLSMILATAALAVAMPWFWIALPLLWWVGASSAALSPAIQVRLLDVAGDARTVAAAVNHSALNLGNALGAYLGGLGIAAGWGYLSAIRIGLVMTVLGLLIALLAFAAERAAARRPPAAAPVPASAAEPSGAPAAV